MYSSHFLEAIFLLSFLLSRRTRTNIYTHLRAMFFIQKKAIPYSQALRLNRICSDNETFDKRCNQLEEWLLDRGYSSKLVRNQVLKARKFSREDLLNSTKTPQSRKLTINITYHPAFSKLKNILKTIHLLL